MKELADDTPKEKVKWGDREFEMMGVNCLKGLPSRQAEGPFAFEYNGNYYLTYPYVRENTEVLGYAMSKNPMGPYEYKAKDSGICSIITTISHHAMTSAALFVSRNCISMPTVLFGR